MRVNYLPIIGSLFLLLVDSSRSGAARCQVGDPTCGGGGGPDLAAYGGATSTGVATEYPDAPQVGLTCGFRGQGVRCILDVSFGQELIRIVCDYPPGSGPGICSSASGTFSVPPPT